MRGTVFIDDDEIGFADFEVVDQAMGSIQGRLNPTERYAKYRAPIQAQVDKKGIANVDDFNFKIVLEDKTVLHPEGGIGITDSKAIDEIIIECAGVDNRIIQRINGEVSPGNR